jgi:hypothetical protein
MPARRRCYLVYALAPEGTSARAANDLVNEYIADGRRGIIVFHDHFTGKPHGGVAVWDVRTDEELALLDDPGQLAGWEVHVHSLTFALTAAGFAAQMEFTLEQYGGMTLAQVTAEEEDDERFWWRGRRA